MTCQDTLDKVITELPVSRGSPDTVFRVGLVVRDFVAVLVTVQGIWLAALLDSFGTFVAAPDLNGAPLALWPPGDPPGG